VRKPESESLAEAMECKGKHQDYNRICHPLGQGRHRHGGIANRIREDFRQEHPERRPFLDCL